MEIIKVSNLNKLFKYPIKSGSFFKDFLYPNYKEVLAVKNLSFSVKKSERIAFIGKNGAGKSSTIKMLTGIVHPTSGEISILGLNPTQDRKKIAYKIGTVFGQRSQLFPNLPFTDSLEFFGKMYDLSDQEIETRKQKLISIFELDEILEQPVRKLSLGQRMKAEVVCALIHNPEIIFLDEPTIGLDIIAKNKLRELLLQINTELGTTIFLTSHDVGDIEYLCERTIIINQGEIVKDLTTDELTKSFIREKYLQIIFNEDITSQISPAFGTEIKIDKNKLDVRVDTSKTNLKEALNFYLSIGKVEDINISNPDLEEVIKHIYDQH